MCNLSKGVEERDILIGLEQGRLESILFSIKNLMDSMDWTAEQAMWALKLLNPSKRHILNALSKKIIITISKQCSYEETYNCIIYFQ